MDPIDNPLTEARWLTPEEADKVLSDPTKEIGFLMHRFSEHEMKSENIRNIREKMKGMNNQRIDLEEKLGWDLIRRLGHAGAATRADKNMAIDYVKLYLDLLESDYRSAYPPYK
jgi:hypothetical protein